MTDYCDHCGWNILRGVWTEDSQREGAAAERCSDCSDHASKREREEAEASFARLRAITRREALRTAERVVRLALTELAAHDDVNDLNDTLRSAAGIAGRLIDRGE